MYLAKTSGSLLPGRGLINPAFVIKIVPATDDLQQNASTGRDNPTDDYLDNIKVGNEVQAKVGKKTIIGRVQRIIKNELGDGVYAIVADSKGKTHKIEGSRISVVKGGIADDNREKLVSSPATFNESKFMDYNQFSNFVK
jgi:hypothetical protein